MTQYTVASLVNGTAPRMCRTFLVVFLAVPLFTINAYAGPIAYDESTVRDLHGGQQKLGELAVGINTVTGSITASVDEGDRWDFGLPIGLEIFQIDYSISNFVPVVTGDRGMFAFAAYKNGAQSIIEDGSFSLPAGDLPVVGPLTLDDHFFMRAFQGGGERVSYNYVVSIYVRGQDNTQNITEDTVGDFELGAGETLKVTSGATLTGNVTVNGGTLILEEDAIIDGNILGTEGGDIVIQGGSTVAGNIEHTGGTLLITEGSTVEGDTIRENTAQSIIEDGSTILGEFMLINPGSVSVAGSHIADGILIDITDAGIFSSSNISIDGSTITGNILIDITDAGIVMEEFSFSTSNSDIAGNILIDITDAGIQSAVSLTDTTVGHNILIDITDAGIQADSYVRLTGVETKNNILIDITDAGLTSDFNVLVEGSQVGNHLKIKGGGTVEIIDNTIVKHLKIRDIDGTCTVEGNVVGGKTMGRK